MVGAFCNSLPTGQTSIIDCVLVNIQGNIWSYDGNILKTVGLFYAITDVLDLLNTTQIDFVVVDALRL